MTDLDERIRAARTGLEQALATAPPDVAELRRRVAARRRLRGAGSAMLAVVLAISAMSRLGPGDEGQRVVAGPVEQGQPLPPGGWKRLSASPLEGRDGHVTAWTGSELLVWGGSGPAPSGETPFGDGAAYSPEIDQWRTLPAAPIGPRANAASVWTGSELLVWGGAAQGLRDDGAAYDPVKGSWRRLPPAPIPGAVMPITLWTGSEMLVIGGINARQVAAAYNPSTDRWRRMAGPPGENVGPEPQGVWTGDEAVLVLSRGSVRTTESVFSYDPDADRWTELAGLAVEGRVNGPNLPLRLVWTGAEVLALKTAPGAVSAALDPKVRRWEPIAQTPESAQGAAGTPVWTGTSALFWTGGEAVTFDVARRSWSSRLPGELPPRDYEAPVWADGVAIVWGGGFSEGPTWTARDDGAMYAPEAHLAPAPAVPTTDLTLPAPAAVAPDLVWVGDLGGSRRTRGIVDLNGPPAIWQGRSLPVKPVLSEAGSLVGYFGCRFFERSEVERLDFDSRAGCPPGGITVAGGSGAPPGRAVRPTQPGSSPPPPG